VGEAKLSGEAKRAKFRTGGQPSEEMLEALATYYERHGCVACGHPPEVMPYLGATLPRKAGLWPLCLVCAGVAEVEHIHFVGAAMPGSTQEIPWATDDRLWFKAHPGAKFRLRLAYQCEVGEAALARGVGIVEAGNLEREARTELEYLILVHELKPGARARMPAFTFKRGDKAAELERDRLLALPPRLIEPEVRRLAGDTLDWSINHCRDLAADGVSGFMKARANAAVEVVQALRSIGQDGAA